MPFFPPDTPHDLFRSSGPMWEAHRDGAPIGPAPHTLNQNVTYGCEIVNDCVSRDGFNIKYKKGMQGHFLGEQKNRDGLMMAKIFIQGVTEHGPDVGDRSAWVPSTLIKKGIVPWRANVRDWPITIESLQGSIRRNWKQPPPSANVVLDKTITKLIQAFYDTPAAFVSSTFTDLVDKRGVSAIAGVILQGIKNAGLYDILQRSDFTKDDVYNAAACKITIDKGSEYHGIYARFQKSGQPEAAFWRPNTWYAYVGHTKEDFVSRFVSHPLGTHRYAQLNRCSTSLLSFAFCRWHGTVDPEMYFVAEQVFVCLFGTYRDNIYPVSAKAGDVKGLRDIEAAAHFQKIYTEVFKDTQWTVPLQRPDFGIAYGANSRSPLEEMGRFTEKMLFIRTDFLVKDVKADTSSPKAEFRRHTPLNIHWAKNHTYFVAYPFYIVATGKNKRVVMYLYMSTPKPDGLNYPSEGAPCQLVFEVNMDGTAHPHAWARLPKVGFFQNWDQANSFAARLEWEHPQGSGNWRFRYLQTSNTRKIVDPKIPGSSKRYAQAMTFLRWLFHVETKVPHPWIRQATGYARVMQIRYDYMTQSISFGLHDPSIRILPAGKLSSAAIKAQMVKFGLDVKEREVEGIFGKRTSCDLCWITALDQEVNGYVAECKKVPGTDVCTNCQRWGLPCCSWTNIPPGRIRSPDPEWSAQLIECQTEVKATIWALHPPDVGPKTFEHDLVELQSGEQGEDEEDEGVEEGVEVIDSSDEE